VIRNIKDENGYEGYLMESESDLWDQVRDHFAYGAPITDEKMKMFQHNDDVINSIVSTIRINK